MKNMHILIATGLYPPESGGPATYTRILEELLPKKGVQVTVVPFSTVRAYPRGIRHILYFWKILRTGKKVTHILALDPVSVGFPACIASMFRFKKFIVKVVGDYAWEQGTQKWGVKDLLDEFVKKGGYPWRVHVLRMMQTFVAKRAKKIITPSAYLQKIVASWGVSPRRIIVIPNAVPNIARAHKTTLRSVLRYHEIIIITIARLVPWKGVEGLIQAVSQASPLLPPYKLLIVGDGPKLASLEALVEKSDIKDHVVFTGSLRHDIAMRYLNAADIFVLNTAYEGFSHLVLESLALGTAVVTTAVGGNIEILDHGKNGLLVPFNNVEMLKDSILSLANDDKKRQLIAQGGKRTAERYTADGMASKLVTLLKSL